MDKLKPLIQHHFWILFGLVLILPIVGWMPAVGQFSQQTTSKIAEIDGAFSKVPRAPQANDSWGKQLNVKAEKAEEKNEEARYNLWKRQVAMMVWPNTIKRDLQPKAYREEISPIARNIYKNNYKLEVRNTWQKIDPFNLETGKGTVIFPQELMPQQTFGDLTPTSEELWNAQEDLWLLESLFKSIRRANSDATILTESLVRSIKTLQLVGGPGDYPQAEVSSSSEFDMADGFGPEYSGMEDEFGSGSGMSQPITAGSVSFKPSDEFGQEQGRYIDYSEGTVFKKRGFYMEAIIDHQRLPELLTVLTNGTWPVTITRVQMAQVGSSAGSMNSSLMDSEMGMSGPGMSSGYPQSSFSGQSATPTIVRPTRPNSPMSDPGSGYLGEPSMSGQGTATSFTSLADAAQFGPQLAVVAISGVIYIYNPPENLADLQAKLTAKPAARIPASDAVPAGEVIPTEIPAVPEEPASDAPASETPDGDAPVSDAPASDEVMEAETAAPANAEPAGAEPAETVPAAETPAPVAQ